MTSRRAKHLCHLAVLVAVVTSLLGGGLAASAGIAEAAHGAEDADYTVEPTDDRTPGATDVTYGQTVVGTAGIDYRAFERMTAVFEEGSWEGCGPSRSEVFGIDRGNTHDGYGVDEGLETHTKTFSAGEDVFQVEFYGEDDFGSTVRLEDGDAVISVANCIDNPDEPGWYQISGSTTGVTASGERKTVSAESHYFWICECEDEAAARETLGPPPSEPEPTATPDGTSTGDDEGQLDGRQGAGGQSGGSAGSGDSGTGGSADSPDDSSDVGSTGTRIATPTPEQTDGGGSNAGPVQTADPASSGGSGSAAQTEQPSSWNDHVVQTPTPGTGDGGGFGGVVAIGSVLVVALLVRRRT